MMEIFESQSHGEKPIPVHAVLKSDLERFLGSRPPQESKWLNAIGFAAKDGELALVPDGTKLGAAVLGLGPGRDPHGLALFSERLPPGTYVLGDVPEGFAGARAAYAWAIGTYSFERYRTKKGSRKELAKLVLPPGVDGEAVSRIAQGVFLARDLINTPANDMGPAELEEAARSIASRYGARLRVVTGDELLASNYPLIH